MIRQQWEFRTDLDGSKISKIFPGSMPPKILLASCRSSHKINVPMLYPTIFRILATPLGHGFPSIHSYQALPHFALHVVAAAACFWTDICIAGPFLEVEDCLWYSWLASPIKSRLIKKPTSVNKPMYQRRWNRNMLGEGGGGRLVWEAIRGKRGKILYACIIHRYGNSIECTSSGPKVSLLIIVT